MSPLRQSLLPPMLWLAFAANAAWCFKIFHHHSITIRLNVKRFQSWGWCGFPKLACKRLWQIQKRRCERVGSEDAKVVLSLSRSSASAHFSTVAWPPEFLWQWTGVERQWLMITWNSLSLIENDSAKATVVLHRPIEWKCWNILKSNSMQNKAPYASAWIQMELKFHSLHRLCVQAFHL